MLRKLILFAVIAILLAAPGCGNKMWEDTKDVTKTSYDYVFDKTPTARSYHDDASLPIIEINYQAADVLARNVSRDELASNSRIYLQVFRNAQNAADNSIFGLLMTQQVSDRLVQRGVHLVTGDPKPEEFFKPENVDMKDYADPVKNTTGDLPPRAAMLDGHYVVGDQYVYMTAYIKRLDDNVIVSGHNWTVPITDNIRLMLNRPVGQDGMTPSVKTQFQDK